MIFIADNQASEILKPGKQPLNLPSALITTKLPAVLSGWFSPSFAMRGNHLNATLIQKPLIQSIAVIGFITNQKIRSFIQKSVADSFINQFYFMGRGAFDMSGDRKCGMRSSECGIKK